jgi:DNA polymerase elongation subunit (family B)
MGRFYYGMITGKFWCAVQNSNDAEEFGGTITDRFEYKCCGCFVEDKTQTYCDGCYESFEDHFSSAIDDELTDEDSKDEPNVLIEECDSIEMSFDDGQLEEVQKHITEYEKVVLPFIKKFTINKEKEYEYDIIFVDEYENDQQKIPELTYALIARWCLAKQVEQCLIDEGSCSFNCEC